MANKGTSPENVVKDIKWKPRRIFNAEEKIWIVLEGLKGEESIASICRRENVHTTLSTRGFTVPIRLVALCQERIDFFLLGFIGLSWPPSFTSADTSP